MAKQSETREAREASETVRHLHRGRSIRGVGKSNSPRVVEVLAVLCAMAYISLAVDISLDKEKGKEKSINGRTTRVQMAIDICPDELEERGQCQWKKARNNGKCMAK